MSTTVTCPACGKQLKSEKQPPAGVLMKCPGCETQFRYQPPAGGLPPAAPPPPLPKRAETKPTPARSAAQAKQRQAAVPQPEPKGAPGGWGGFILVTMVLFAAVAGGGYYFGKDYLPDFAAWFPRKVVEPPKPDEKEEKKWDDLFDPEKPEGDDKPAVAVAVNQGEDEGKPAPDEPDRSRPKRFASGGSNDVLIYPEGGSQILDVEYSPDGRVLATFDGAGFATLWDVKTRRALDVTPAHWGGSAHSENGRHVAFSPDGKTLVFGTSHRVAVIDLPEGRVRWHKWGTVSSGNTLMVSPSVRTVAILETGPGVHEKPPLFKIYDVASGKQIFRQSESITDYSTDLILSPDDKLLAMVDGVHEKIRLFEIPSGKEFDGIKGVHPRGMLFVKDSTMLLLPDTGIRQRQIWNLSSPERPKLEFQVSASDLQGSDDRITPDGNTLVALPNIWDIGQRKPRAKFAATGRYSAVSPDSQRVAYWGVSLQRPELVIADASNGATLTVLNIGNVEESLPQQPSCAAISPDGNQVAVGTAHGAVILRTISGNTPTTGSSASASPTGAPRELASFQFVAPDNLQESLKDQNKDFASNVWISPDGRWLVTNGNFTTLWNLEQRKQHMVLTLNDGRGTNVNKPTPPVGLGGAPKFSGSAPNPMYCRGWLFHADGKSFTAVGNNTPVFYDIVAGTHLIDGNAPKYESIKSSPDGRVAVSWIERYDPPLVPGERQARTKAPEVVWDLAVLDGGNGKLKKVLGTFLRQYTRPFKYDPYRTVSISADGRRLAATAFDKPSASTGVPRVMIWEWESGRELPINVNANGLSQLELIDGGKSLVTVMGARFRELIAEVYDIETGTKQYDVSLNKGHTGSILAIAFDLTRPLFVTADEHGMVLLRDLNTGDPRTRFKAHDAAITAIYLSSDGRQLATAAKDRTAKLWDVEKLLQSK